MKSLEIRLLGDFFLAYDGNPVTGLNKPRLQSLLAYLVLHGDVPQFRYHLAGMLWPDSPEAQAHTNLRNLVFLLRQALPEVDHLLRASSQTLQWDPELPFSLDVRDFQQIAAHDSPQNLSLENLETAVRLYKGDLLLSCYDEWVFPEREHYRQVFITLLDQLIDRYENLRRYTDAIALCQRLVAEEPFHKDGYPRLMRLFALNGETPSALKTYQDYARLLKNELGIEPAAEIQEFYAQVRRAAASGAQPQAGYPTPPLALLPLVGRAAEWQAFQTLWKSVASGNTHMLLICNEAGMGKAHLAEEMLGWATRLGIRTGVAHCYDSEEPLPYAPIIEWLRASRLPPLERTWLAELSRLLPELRKHSSTAPVPASGLSQRLPLFEALARAVLGARQKTLLLIEDLQWCDHDTLEWLNYLLRFDPHAPLLVVGTLYSEEAAGLAKFELPEGMSLLDLGAPHLKGLENLDHLYQVCAPGLPGAFPRLPASIIYRNNLPAQLTSFIGRVQEIEQVRELVAHHRLVTLTGAGGIGKTRLALRVAENILETFVDGVWLVELAPLSEPGLLPNTCIQALGLINEPGVAPLTLLAHYLEKKKLLLVLDNCEHVIAACTHMADALLKACPGLHILATSREILAVPGEYPFRVPSLAVPEAQALPRLEEMGQIEAVQLFVERAAQAAPGFTLREANAQAVVQICRRLDGIPLALEFAAARVRMMSAEQIAGRLDNAFHLLTGGSSALLPRQRTLKAAIDWSYDLLSPEERLLFQRLSVFAGGWTLEAAEAVCVDGSDPEDSRDSTGERVEITDVLDLLAQLADKSLIIVTTSLTGSSRYRLLETIRQYGSERLLESKTSQAARDRHLAYFASLSGEAEPHLRGKDQVEWLDRLEEELDNLRTAIEWALAGRIELGLKIAADLMWLWWVRNHFSEGNNWLVKLLSAEKSARETRRLVDRRPQPAQQRELDLQRARGLRALHMGRTYDESITSQERRTNIAESVTLLRGLGAPARRELGMSLYYLLPWTTGREQPSTDRDEMLEIFQQENMRFYYAHLLNNPHYRPWVSAAERGRRIADLEASLAILRELEDLDGIADGAVRVAVMTLQEGNYPRAEALVNESIAICQRTRNRWFQAECYGTMADIALAQGKQTEADSYCQQAQKIFRDPVEKNRLAWMLIRQLKLAWSVGEYEEAARLGQQILGFSQEVSLQANYYLGRAAMSQGKLDQAGGLLKKAIEDVLRVGWDATFLEEGYAALLSRQGQFRQAARLFGAVEAGYRVVCRGLPLRERQENEEAFDLARISAGEETFARDFAEGQLLAGEKDRFFG